MGLPIVDGESSIRVDLPGAVCLRSVPFTVRVQVFWAFDEAGHLIDVDVEQTVDGL